MQIMVSKFGLFVCGCVFATHFSSCTYAPRNTKIDQTYNARQMAVGVTEQSQESMTSTISEEESIAEGDISHASSESTSSRDGYQQVSYPSLSSSDKRLLVPTPDFITIGSSKSDVVRVQGTPTRLTDLTYSGDVWDYGYSSITFDTRDKVKEWSNTGNLKVKMQIP
jgi:hypothetical protein